MIRRFLPRYDQGNDLTVQRFSVAKPFIRG